MIKQKGVEMANNKSTILPQISPDEALSILKTLVEENKRVRNGYSHYWS